LAQHHDPAELRSAAEEYISSGNGREQYFSRPGTFLISRFSIIRADSTLISACANGYRYGMAQIDEQFTSILPAFLYKNKARINENNYLANVSGLSPDNEHSQPIFSAVADSYGAFGWLGVVLFPILGFSAVFVVYESMFDFSRPWGLAAFATCALNFSEMSMWRVIPLVLRVPLTFLLLSYLVGIVGRVFAMKGDRS
jgi:hypothetical protein